MLARTRLVTKESDSLFRLYCDRWSKDTFRERSETDFSYTPLAGASITF